jgi:hypothetical protein
MGPLLPYYYVDTVHSTQFTAQAPTFQAQPLILYTSQLITSLLLYLFQPFVHPHPRVRLVSVHMGEQSNILILLLQGLILLAKAN